ncbi:hypothetical protein [Gemmobacter serpentinus]|uniref:hypothetical protein n=1 Tax=Gemmobacter serpentinus TaxID=2652247 RepID=UPI00124EBF80|nr:hypothetical protein [Gemmobacter serpentinus]
MKAVQNESGRRGDNGMRIGLGQIGVSTLVAMGLGACVAQVTPQDTSSEISLLRGGSFAGGSEMRIYPDGVVQTEMWQPGGRDRKLESKQLSPEVFARARQSILDHPIPARKLNDSQECLDYGIDRVQLKEPGREVSYRSYCPNPAIDALDGMVRAAITP